MTVNTDTSFLQNKIHSQKINHLYRKLRNITRRSGMVIEIEGCQMINFSSNDYLGLSVDSRLAEASADAGRRWGTGSGSSRLVSGSCQIHHVLEQHIADLKGEEAALIYPSGFQANIGLLAAVAETGDTVFVDRLVHASLIDATRLSGASLKVYPHLDFETLRERLKKIKSGKRFVVTDAYFSMDGDVARLTELAQLCHASDAHLIVDEAHSHGVFGPKGAGLTVQDNIQGQCLAVVGTFSKAFGSQGGFVAGSKVLKEVLVNHSRAFIYSTGVSPSIVGASIQGVYLASNSDVLRDRLHTTVSQVRMNLVQHGYDLGNSIGPIIPILCKSTDQAISLSEYLLAQGILAPAIRPPTVPKGTDRVRITLTATHSAEHIQRLLVALQKRKEKI